MKDLATQIAHRAIPAAGSEWPLTSHGRAIALAHAASIIQDALDAVVAKTIEATAEGIAQSFDDNGTQHVLCSDVATVVRRSAKGLRTAADIQKALKERPS